MQTDSQIDATTQADVPDNGGTLTAGDILRQERERLGLNEKEIADQLHITMHYVKALESSQFEKLPGAVFAKGYLKSYALLLGLDVEDLLSRYDEFAHQQKADSDEETRLLRARKKKDRNKPFVIVSLIVFVAGFLGLWLANSYFSEETVSDVPSTAESMPDAENIRPALSQVLEQQQNRTEPQLSLDVEPEATSLTVPQSAVIPSSDTAAVATTEPAVELATALALDANEGEGSENIPRAEGAESTESGESAENTDIATASEPAQSPTLEELTDALQALREEQAAITEPVIDSEQPRVITVEAIGNDILRISFTGESWVEVNDSESEQIYRDIREAGDVLEITGSAPFNILLGDAPFTRMSLNGNEIDLSEDIRIDNSARLTVGL